MEAENPMKASKSQSMELAPELMFDALPNSGESGSLMTKVDWANTSLGPPSQWPASLSTAVSICLISRFPIVLLCGPDFVLIYNDSYAPMLGQKHPQALGKPGYEVWSEIWNVIGPMLQGVRDTGNPTWSDDLLLVINRTGYLEEAYFTFSYTPVGVHDGQISAVFSAVNFTTERVIGERRLRTLRDLGTQSRVADTSAAAAKGMLNVLSKNNIDVPFALIYLFDKSTSTDIFKTAKLVSSCGIDAGTEVSPWELDTQQGLDGTFKWPIEEALRTRKVVEVDCSSITHLLPKAPWDDPPTHAVILPIAQAGHDEHNGIFIAGVSARKRLDEPYLDFYQLVASQIAMAIINAEAYQAERRRVEELAKIDQAKSAFFSNVSHELRTPLTLMLSPIEDLLDDKHKLSVFQFERMQLVQRNTQRLLKLVNSLLDFSRIEANRMQAIFEPTDLVELTSNLAGAFRSTVEKAGLKLIIETSPLNDLVYVDKEMWEKIVFNLLSNAFKFTFEGFIQVSLHKKENSVELRVQDTGVGIPEEEQARVFERFHRVETIQGRSFEGTGIGLALVHELVKLHSGTIRLESVRGEGTTFILTIPLGTSHLSWDQMSKKREQYNTGKIGMAYVEEARRWVSDPGDPEKAVTSFADDQTPFFETLTPIPTSSKLLICDDNYDMRMYLRSILEAHWQVATCCNGVEALESIKKSKPDLVLTDVMMPQMDGFQLLNALRNDHETSSMPVIMVSARAGEEARVEGLHAGADDYLVKPFSAKELLARVHTHLELGQLRRKLEEGIEQRTQQLQEANEKLKTELSDRLQAEKELAIESSRAQSAEEYKKRQEEFVNTICHEIRNPLNGIYGGIDLLQQAIIDTENMMSSAPGKILPDMDKMLMEKLLQLKELVENISRCAVQQKTIVDDVLDLSKIQNNKIELVLVPFNPKQVLITVVQMFTAQISQKKLKLSLYISDVDFWVKGDPHRLTQVITNLVSNAIKFTHEGSITLGATVQKKHSDGNKMTLKFSVQDTGIGMTGEEQTSLFGDFIQANRSISSEYGGSGLGLSISKKLVALMGGKITVKSEKWQGSKFTFTITCTACSPEEYFAFNKPEKKRSMSSITRTESVHKNILVVEDNRINQTILVRHLQDGGYFCRTASNGNEAIEMYQKFSFDLIFMDIEMPGMNGLLATEEIRKIESATKMPRVPIIGLSGNARKEQMDQALQCGMTDYLTKPYQKNELYQKIFQYTEQQDFDIPPPPSKHAKGDTKHAFSKPKNNK